MSRIGKKPIAIPAGVDVKIDGAKVTVKGPKGELSNTFNADINVAIEGNEIIVSAKAYARMVEIICEDGDVLFDDNYFDLNADSRRIRIIRGEGTKFSVRSVYNIR